MRGRFIGPIGRSFLKLKGYVGWDSEALETSILVFLVNKFGDSSREVPHSLNRFSRAATIQGAIFRKPSWGIIPVMFGGSFWEQGSWWRKDLDKDLAMTRMLDCRRTDEFLAMRPS